ncbi:MAG TPA: class I SAM-dependent methyltransferase [Terriglobales bacterium]|nr:class I SAM-dependent methyltransferase [Terriglobales bacterium]
MPEFEEQYFEDPRYPPGLKGGDEVRGYGYYPDYFAIVEAQLSSLVELTAGETLLDVGCGKGALAAYAREDLGMRVVGTDASRHAIRFAARRVGGQHSVRADCAQLPFAGASFDLVWCNGVLQYLEAGAARAALAGMARVCRTAVFVSNIAWAQQHTEWGRRDRLTRLYLRPRQWAALAAEAAAEAMGEAVWHAVALPFEGEAAILLIRAGALPPSFPLRFVELSLERMRRLGALSRTPPGLDAFYRAQWKSGGLR